MASATVWGAIGDQANPPAEIYQGAVFSEELTYLDSSGVAIDITGYTIECKIGDIDYSALVFTPTCTITTASAGKFTVSLSSATTAAVTPVPSTTRSIGSPAFFDTVIDYQILKVGVFMTPPSGGKVQAFRGDIKFYPSTAGLT